MDPKPATGAEPLDFEVVIELVELERIDPRLETTRLGTDSKRLRVPDWDVPGTESSAHHVVDDLLEAPSTFACDLLEPSTEIFVKCQRGPHTDIMMSECIDVKMLKHERGGYQPLPYGLFEGRSGGVDPLLVLVAASFQLAIEDHDVPRWVEMPGGD